MFDQYRLKPGDTLKSVAKKFSTNESTLKDLNNIYYSDSVRAGMDIIVPKNTNTYFTYYTIESGDSLYGIARRYNINPELLASLNGLEMDDFIYPGQEILIPKSEYSYYITKDGDTLDTVSGMFKISKNKLLDNNSTIYLQSGQILVNKIR